MFGILFLLLPFGVLLNGVSDRHDRGGGEFLASFLPSLYIHSVLQVLVGHLYIYIFLYRGVTADILYWSTLHAYSVYDYKYCCTQQAVLFTPLSNVVVVLYKCQSVDISMDTGQKRGSPLPSHSHLRPI